MSWTKTKSLSECLSFISQVSDLCYRLSDDGPLCSMLNSMIQSGRYREVIEYEFEYDLSEISFRDYKYARQIHALLSKQSYLPLGLDPEGSALNKFKIAEEKCRITNDRLSLPAPNGAVSIVSHYAQRKISELLGDLPPFGSLDFSFGPGASTNVKAAVANYRVKLSAGLSCSLDLIPRAGEFLAELPQMVAHHSRVSTISGSNFVPVVPQPGKLQFVPKTSLTHRPIVVEPLLNGLLQKGFGSFIRERLLTVGVNLRDQKRNQQLAFVGSLTNRLATIDLANASDTVSIATVLSLLPPQWSEILSYLRTGDVVYGSEHFHLEKFSSMGNGFTFELESLIFWALSTSVCSYLSVSTEEVSVYGDDIVIPVEAAGLLKEVLEYYGFEVNTKKSFSSGPFRESCGADFLSGMDIRPFYLRDKISDSYLYTFHNWAIRNCEREIADLVLSYTNPSLRLFGPDGYGDGHLIGSYNLRNPSRRKLRAGWCGGFFDTYTLKKKYYRRLLPGDWQVPCYSCYTRSGERDPSDPDVVRGSSGYTKISIYTLATSIFRRI